MKTKFILLLSFLLVGMFNISNAQPGSLDHTYGEDGIAVGSSYTAESHSIALQQDGKIIAASSNIMNSVNGFTLSRTNTNGSIDMSFGNEGIVFTGISELGASVASIKIQEDGKIVAAGYYVYPDTNGTHFFGIIVIRYNENGSTDSGFGVNGIATTSIGDKGYTTCMALQSDGKIVVGGRRNDDDDDTENLFMVRFLSNGAIDESFADNGKLLEFFTSSITVTSIAIQPEDQKIILGGMYTSTNQGAYFLTCYLSDGERNLNFGNNGEAQIKFGIGSSASTLNEIALQADGKIVAAGRTYNPSTSLRMTIVRFLNNGTIDNSFGENGIKYIQFDEDESEANTVLVQNDGKIISAGYRSSSNTYYHFALARLNSDGNLDASFGIDGLKTDIIINDFTVPYAGVLQNDGKLVLAGGGSSANVSILVRYNTEEAILPITYTKFTAAQSQQYITLNWQTATELNNRYFAIERSGNAVNYAAIAQINSAGAGATAHEYNFTDRQPVQGTNYYRLKQTDADGKYSYSKVVSINYIKPGTLLLLPNPAKDKLTVKGLNAANVSTISLLDIQGNLIQQFTAKQLAAYTFNISNLSAGTYMVRVKDNNGVVAQKFVKQ